MMSKSQSAAWQKLRFLTLIPVIGLLLLVFSCEREELDPQLTALVDFPEVIKGSLPVEELKVVPYENPLNTFESADQVFDIVEQQPNPPGGMSGWNQYLATNLQYPFEARRKGIEGTVIVVFEIHTDGSIRNVEILRGIGGGADQEAIRVVQNSPSWEPGKQRGRDVTTRMRLPIRFKLASIDASNTTSSNSIEEQRHIASEPLQEIAVIGYQSLTK